MDIDPAIRNSTDERPPRFRKVVLLGCVAPIAVVLAIPLGIQGCHLWYFHQTKSAFTSNRAYYESLVRQIERDAKSSDRYLAYELVGDRHAGTLRRLLPESVGGEVYDLIKDWRIVTTQRGENGELYIRFPTYLLDLVGYGILYCSSDLSTDSVGWAVDSEGSIHKKLEARWWTFSTWLGH
jgi:hypothetical protein